MGGVLATITSAEMNSFILNSVNSGNTQSLFIGVEVANQNLLVDLDGAPITYSNLRAGSDMTKSCVVQIRDPKSSSVGMWKTEDCNISRTFICIQDAT
jgi:hypothetical protein